MVQEPALRIKYLDWCSAKIAEHIFALDPDGFWLLAQRAGEASRVPAAGGGPGMGRRRDRGDAGGHRRSGRPPPRADPGRAPRAAPSRPDEWSALYAANPAAYEREILGFRPPRA
jgi:hypothetical protein